MTDPGHEAPPTTHPSFNSQTLLSQYFLHRLGLTSDELYWPATVEQTASTTSAIDQDIVEAWRIRDVVADILRKNGVPSDWNEEEVDDGNKDGGGLVPISSILEPLLPSEKDVTQFLWNKADDDWESDDEEDSDGDSYEMENEREGTLNIDHVHKAFSAAAYSILRGYKRSTEKNLDGQFKKDMASIEKTKATQNLYEPPLARAMESIRTSRIQSLNEASGKSVAPFLKKNNTIPWFHVPIVTTSSAANTSLSTVVKVSNKQFADGKANHEDVKVEKIVEECGHATAKPLLLKRSVPESNETCNAEKRPKLDEDHTKSNTGKHIAPTKIKQELDSDVTNAPNQKSSTKSPPMAPIRMDSRANVSRAIICAAAAVVFQGLTPDYEQPDDSDNNDKMKEWQIDPTEMPRHVIETESAKRVASKKKKDLDITVDDAMQQARSIGEHALDRALGAARRNDRRREFRLDVARGRMERSYASFQREVEGKKMLVAPGHSLPLVIPNPFAMRADEESRNGGTDSEGMDTDEEGHRYCLTEGPTRKEGDDEEWTKKCLPRLLAILRTGSGHAIFHDVQWGDRFYHAWELLRNMATLPTSSNRDRPPVLPNYGPHLIITSSGPDFESFAAVFAQLGHGLRVVRKDDEGNDTRAEDVILRVLPYHGSKDRRRRLRKHFGSLSPSPDSPFCFLGGHADSPYHIILTGFSAFAEDYAHFCQIPFQAVILDDGMSWLGCAQSDPNSKLGKVWDTGLWSGSDHGAGMAGVSSGWSTSWDFSKDDGGIGIENLSAKPSPNKKDIAANSQGEKPLGKQLIGLTARYRILLASSMHATCNGHTYTAPIHSLLSFLAPHFMDIVRDDWDRSKLSQCERCKSYLRKLIARSVVVYGYSSNSPSENDMFSVALQSLNGEISSSSSSLSEIGLCLESKEIEGIKKNSLQRKDAMAWFRPDSAMLKELNESSLDSILATVKSINALGFVCEEIVTASSLTTSGANGAVTGPAAYRTAVRCGRAFSNEQSLRQHIVAFHAPAGTWLCRSCGIDCVTSQARAHHERSCSVTDGGIHATLLSAVKTPVPLKENRRGPKKKEVKNLAAAKVRNDNSSRVPGYKGVWVMSNGKYYIKTDDRVISADNKDDVGNEMPLLFDTVEAAAKKHDQILKESGKAEQSQMNYGPDGLRIIHKEETTTGFTKDDPGALEGGTASSLIVPALAVINIKDLPKDVKPLLRDPNQTSRTGGNSKRYVYAYRGVCRQARKGHDRWQAQISFNGCNHYLGTFDSEWDAAAVYAWAHLILYGEEATKKAQQEGEEAAAAYEQLQKDIAEGKIPPPAPTPPKKKKNPPGAPKGSKGPRKKDKVEQPVARNALTNKNEPIKHEKVESDIPDKLIVARKEKQDSKTPKDAELTGVPKPNSAERESTYTSMYSKKEVPQTLGEWNKLKTGCAMMLSSGTKGTSKANLLATRKNLAAMNNTSLLDNFSERLTTGSIAFLKSIISFGDSFKSLPTCIPLSSFAPSSLPQSSALLIGLSAAKFSWDPDDFISTCRKSGACYGSECAGKLAKEYGKAGMNASFRSLLLSSPCLIGRATKASQKNYRAVQIKYTLGMSVESVGCHVAGPEYSCSEAAAKIELRPTQYSRFQFLACSDEDIVTLNGKRIQSSMGPFPLRNNDICSVGARVFVFIESYSLSHEERLH